MKFSALTLALPIVIILILSATHLSCAQNAPGDFLPAHNAARLLVSPHFVPPLTWNDTLARHARRLASDVPGDCRPRAPYGGPFGVNNYTGSRPRDIGVAAVAAWVREKKYYIPILNRCEPGHECRHYLQVVWGRSRMLGCAREQCSSDEYVVICLYEPRMNWPKERPYVCMDEATEAEEEATEEAMEVVDSGKAAIISEVV